MEYKTQYCGLFWAETSSDVLTWQAQAFASFLDCAPGPSFGLVFWMVNLLYVMLDDEFDVYDGEW